MPASIAQYAAVGDGRTCALISRAGSVEFLCWPRFDSDACFAALLGDARHGCWRLAPAGSGVATRRRYRGETAILETMHEAADGRVRVIDFMPWDQGPTSLVRIVEGVDGRVPMEMLLRLRFGYGRIEPWTHENEGGLCAEIGPDRVLLHAGVAVERNCYKMQGRTDEARAMLERVIASANDIGLLREEYHVPTQQPIGNMPQTLSHLSLVNTALSLSGPVIQRGGG